MKYYLNKSIFFYLVVLILFSCFVSAVFVPEVEWEKTFGEGGWDEAYSIQQTSDSGYIVAGGKDIIISTYPFLEYLSQFWLIKTDFVGNHQWNKTFFYPYWSTAHSVQQTSDGGYIAAGVTGDVPDLAGYRSNLALIKTDANGNAEWNKTFSQSPNNEAHSVRQTSDGGYIIAGYTGSTGLGSSRDFWLIKTDSNGNEEWNKTFGNSNNDDVAYSLQQTSDNGYILAGHTGPISAGYDIWLIKTDANGNEEWNKTWNGSVWDFAYSVQQTSDRGYILAGFIGTYGGGAHRDFWLIKTYPSGNEEWNKTFGGSGSDQAESVQQTSDGGYIVAGITDSFGAGNNDFWLIKTDSNGNEEWNNTFGSSDIDKAYSVQQTSDGSYIVAGFTGSLYDTDVYLIKLKGPLTEDCDDGIDNDYDNYIDSEDQDCPFKITLEQGWNLLGYTFPTRDITTALSSIDGCYESVYSFWSGLWRSFIPFKPPELNKLTNMTFGRGYWIKVNCTSTELFEFLPGKLKYTKIAFVSNRDGNYEIYAMNADGTDQNRLTFNESFDRKPSWSPDGEKIAFMSDKYSSYFIYNIFTMNAAGTNITRLTYNDSHDMDPVWSPDGTKIAFVSERDGNYEIYVMNADGSNQTRLTFNESFDISPSWLPYTTKIAFSSSRYDSGKGINGIYVMNSDGSNQTMITNNLSRQVMELALSPDGSKIAFADSQMLYIMNLDGSNQTALYGTGRKPTWSPDGKWLAFRIGADGGIPEVPRIQNIYKIDSAGSNIIKLTNEDNNTQWNKISHEPSWSPFLYSTN